MPENRRSLLVVAVPASIFARFPPLLWRDIFDVNTVENPRLALRAVESTAFSLILLRFPLPDFDFQRFLDEVRAFGSPCRRTPVAAVVSVVERAEAEAFIGRGLNRVLVASDSDEELLGSVASLLDVAPRSTARLPIDLRTTVQLRNRRLLAQTVNLSKSGMLLTDPGGFEVGADFRFELELPGKVVAGGLASVVRIEQRALSPRCCGAQFLELDEGSQVKLDHYLASLTGGESE